MALSQRRLALPPPNEGGGGGDKKTFVCFRFDLDPLCECASALLLAAATELATIAVSKLTKPPMSLFALWYLYHNFNIRL